MKSNELRIGNLVEFYINNECKNKEHIIDADDIKIFSEHFWYNLKPIPLTEEWLLKFGFEFNGWNWDFESYIFHAQGKNEKGEFINTEFGIRKNKEVFNVSFKIQFVHQLQNLYFALTQRELTLS